MALRDMTGQRYGQLVVTGLSGRNKFGGALWACRCDCGGSSIVKGDALRSGRISSCCGVGRIKHGLTRNRELQHPLYRTWALMRNRCTNPTNYNYKNYGGRGIAVCDRWDDFTLFVLDVGDRPPGTTLDRINNDGDYEPGNIRWATRKEQAQNRRPPSSGWWSNGGQHPRWKNHVVESRK